MKAILRETFQSFSRHGGRLLAAGVAFYALLSAVPILVIALYIASFVTNEARARAELLHGLSRFLGPTGAGTLGTLLDRVDSAGGGPVVGILHAFLLIYASTRLFGALRQSVNHLWDIEPRPRATLGASALVQVERRVGALFLVILIGIILIASVAAKALIAAASGFVDAYIDPTIPLWMAEQAVSFVVVVSLFGAMMKLLPDVRISWHDVWFGAALTGLLFSLGSSLIGYYLGKKGLSSTWGPGGSIVLLLLWVSYSAQIFFLGVAFTGVWARLRGHGLSPAPGARRIPRAAMSRQPLGPQTQGPSHLLVGNPTAQSGKNAARIERAVRYMEDHGVGCDVLHTLPGGATIEAVTKALDAGSYQVVIAMGGDGTFREVAAGLYGSLRREEVALGMLPTGTANDQGKSFGLSSDDAALEDNIDVLHEASETRLDAGIMTLLNDAGETQKTELFFDSAGWGISARVLATRNDDRKKVEATPGLREVYRDKLVYAGALLRTFLESYVVDDKFTAIVDADGERQELSGVSDLIVKGTRIYAGAWVFDKTSRHDDGQFEMVPFRGKRDWTSKAIVDIDGNPLTEEMLNKIGVVHSKPFRASTFEVRFVVAEGAALPAAQLDGEELEASPRVRIEVVPRAIRLIVPQKSTPLA